MKTTHHILISMTAFMLWGCPEDPTEEPKGGEMAGDVAGGEETDVDPFVEAGSMTDMAMDMDLSEPNPCESDDQCFPGRICVEGSCEDAECQEDSDCSAEVPLCFGQEGEEPGQRRGRCGNCASSDECYGASTCVTFEGIGEDSSAGRCELNGNCAGNLECSPSSSQVMRGPQSEVCLDRRSSERDPICGSAFNCQEMDSCPEGLKCLDSGQCAALALSEECEENLQCSFDEVCRGDGLCGPCEDDSDCRNDAQICRSGQCQEIPSACTEDSDCLGARRCVLNECAAPECNEDFFEGNDAFDRAVEIDGDRIYRGLMSCADDWFTFTLAPQMSALVKVRQRDRGANLGIVVVDGEERELGRSVGSAPVEAVRLRESAGPRVIFVRVFQEGEPSVAEYDLEILYTPSGSICLDDPFELNGGDDTADTARMIRYSSNESFPNEVRGQVCLADTDYLCFEMRRGELLSINGAVDLGDALVIGSLIDPQGGMIAEGRWAADQNPSDINQEVEQSGRYCLALNSDDENGRRTGQGRYTLQLNGVSPELADLCEEKQLLMITDNRGGDSGTLSGDDVLRASCAPNSDGPEMVYTVNVTEPSLMVARVSGSPAGSLGDPVLSLRGQCDQDNSEIACSARGYDVNNPFIIPPNPAVLRAALVPPVDPVTGEGIGQYSLILDGETVGDDPRYQLDVELRPLAPPPLNENCDRISELMFVDGVAVAETNLDQARADLNSCSQNGPDATYQFTLETESQVMIQVGSKPAEFPVIVSLSDQCGGPEIACGFGLDETLAAGTYHLTVAGADEMSRGLTELQLVVMPLPDAPGNDTCDDAISLEGDSGTVSGNTMGATNDYELGANNLCTRYNSNSGEVVYRYSGRANQAVTFTAVPEEGWDLSLYILSACQGNIENACITGQDEALTETLTFIPTNNADVFVVVDGASGESGAFELSWSLDD